MRLNQTSIVNYFFIRLTCVFLVFFVAQYPHYLAGGANPHDLQAAAAAAGAYGALHNNLPPSAALNSYPRPALVSIIINDNSH